MISEDEIEARRIAKAIAWLVAQVSQHGGTPDVVYLSPDAADEMGVNYTPAETAEGNE